MIVCVMNAGKVLTVTSRREPVPVKTHVVKAVSTYGRLSLQNIGVAYSMDARVHKIKDPCSLNRAE